MSSFSTFLSGVIGGFSLVIVSHPFDLIKVKMQADQKGQLKAWKAIQDSISGRWGIFGLYRGVTPVFMGAPVS